MTYEQVIEQVKALPPEAVLVIAELAAYLAQLNEATDWEARRQTTLRKFSYDRAAIMREMAKTLSEVHARVRESGATEEEIEADIHTAIEEVRAERRALRQTSVK